MDRILVQRVKAETKTAGGIFLPEAAVKDLNEAKVLAVGPGLLDKDGKRIAPSVKPGDKVLIPQVSLMLLFNGPDLRKHNDTNISHQYGGTALKVGEDDYSLYRDSEILAKLSE